MREKKKEGNAMEACLPREGWRGLGGPGDRFSRQRVRGIRLGSHPGGVGGVARPLAGVNRRGKEGTRAVWPMGVASPLTSWPCDEQDRQRRQQKGAQEAGHDCVSVCVQQGCACVRACVRGRGAEKKNETFPKRKLSFRSLFREVRRTHRAPHTHHPTDPITTMALGRAAKAAVVLLGE